MFKNLLKGVIVVPAVLFAVVGIFFALVGVGFTAVGKYLLALADD